MKPMMSAFEDRDVEIYLDNAATTMMSEEVVVEMAPYLEERYGNPEAHYHLGREAKDAVELARERVAVLAGCKPKEVFFTSGGTEANNWAIKGLDGDSPVFVGQTEHASVLEPARWLGMRDLRPSHLLPVSTDGIVDVDEFKRKINDEVPGLISIQYANNETGAIQPVEEIAALCREAGVVFHCDAVQAVGKIPVDMREDGISMMTLSAHKIHGPMGVGALCIKDSLIHELDPLIHGGGHQDGMRSGTLPVPLIVGFGKAAEMACSWRRQMDSVRNLRNLMAQSLKERMGAVILGGDNVLPNILGFILEGTESVAVCGILCEQYGVCMSTGSACSRGEDSHVLKAMGIERANLKSSYRASLGINTDKRAVLIAVDRIQAAIAQAKERDML